MLSFAFTLFCCYDQESLVLRLSHCRVVHFCTRYPVETMAGPLESTHLAGCSPATDRESAFVYTYWWTWRESNPRPRHFSVYFIQPYISTLTPEAPLLFRETGLSKYAHTRKVVLIYGAPNRIRTGHLPLTRRLLYQMSYRG